MSEKLPRDSDSIDLTPEVGAGTDVAPLGHPTPKPSHERTADEERAGVDWQRLAATTEFQSLLRAKMRFVVPACFVSMIYYFALPLLVGYAPELLSRKVWGVLNVAYLFALSQFFMAWLVAALYIRAANRFDRQAKLIVEMAATHRNQGGR
ncbi:MAG: DUF485 domain-containing protein [Acidobacteriota bacterium]